MTTTRLRRKLLYPLATSDRIETWVRSQPALERRAYQAAQRYVAGTSLGEALDTIARLNRDGLAVSLDLFGEGAGTEDDIERTVGAYLDAATALVDSQADAYLEIVPSHLGLDNGVTTCLRHVTRIVQALRPDMRLQISAEESWRTEGIMDLAMRLAGEGASVMVTLQANLRRSAADADRLTEVGIPIRLVKGAYLEAPDVAYPWGQATDLAFVELARKLRQRGVQLSLATHDPVIREALLNAWPNTGHDLVQRGHHVRIYVPYGASWFRYWARRAVEAQGA